MVNPASAILPIRRLPFRRQLFCGLSGCFKRIQGAISVVCMNFLPYPVLDREEVVLCDGLGL